MKLAVGRQSERDYPVREFPELHPNCDLFCYKRPIKPSLEIPAGNSGVHVAAITLSWLKKDVKDRTPGHKEQLEVWPNDKPRGGDTGGPGGLWDSEVLLSGWVG